jgi:hypothetical protein
MLTDSLLAFVPNGSNLSLVGAAGVAIPSGVLDLLGVGVGQAPQSIIGNVTTFGEDPGIGGKRSEIQINIGTALVAGVAGTTLSIALQGAADTGAGGGYQPSTWTDIADQDNIALANLTAGAVPFRFPFLPSMPPGLRPRFLRLLFSPTSSAGAKPSGDFSAGTILFAGVVTVRDDWAVKYAARNYTVA